VENPEGKIASGDVDVDGDNINGSLLKYGSDSSHYDRYMQQAVK
jgi:hypothetical protein